MDRRTRYGAGDWFALPFEEGGYALGLVARAWPRHPIAVGYFFGPRRETIPPLEDAKALRAEDAVLIRRFGDGELRGGGWPLLGQLPGWRREDWPLPDFFRVDPDGRAWRVTYWDDDPLRPPRERIVPISECRGLPSDGSSGSAALAVRLAKALAGEPPPDPQPVPAAEGSPAGSDSDRAVNLLRRHGSDPALAHDVDFYLYVPTRALATEAGRRLAPEGYSVRVEEAVAGGWLALASTRSALTEDVLARHEERFQTLARELGGNYDGWDAELRRG